MQNVNWGSDKVFGWRGKVSIRPGRVAYTGVIGAAQTHTHAAVQIYLCEEGAVDVTGESGLTVTATAVVIPAGAKHSVRAEPGTAGTTLFIDPSSTWAPATGAWTANPAGWTDDAQADFARTATSLAFTASPSSSATFGERVEEWVRSKLPDAVVVTDLAESLSISPATLRRRASAELGLGVQTYVRWVRLIVALEHVVSGASITDAATAAGFSDGSHATRACREMFGLAPSDAVAQLTSL